MKKTIFVACACIMFLSVILTGCEFFEEEKDFVVVTVKVVASVVRMSSTTGQFLGFYNDGYVLFDITKSGGEGVHEQKRIINGVTDPVAATFNVYREQRIEILGTVQGYDPDLDTKTQAGRKGKIITWDQIFEQAGGFGESCAFSETLTLTMFI